MNEEKIIDPQPRHLLRAELREEFLLKTSNRGGFEIYVVTPEQCPSVMKEIGRLREISFRHIKAGTGKSTDIDEFDKYFEQLVIWDPKKHEIAGGYRIQTLLKLRNSAINKESFSPLTSYFHLSKRFVEKYLPYTAEFGRAFVQPDYQRSFALEALFDGLGFWINKKNSGSISWTNPVTFLIGKVTLYPQLGNLDPIYHFFDRYFPSKNSSLIKPKGEYGLIRPYGDLSVDVTFTDNFEEDFSMLAKRFNASILIALYGRLSIGMQCFGTIFNELFGNTEETAIMIKVPNIFEKYIIRYNIKKHDKTQEK
ncbi:TPA: GNAT family N-acetyltransferase [Patescibacteria group bacterium]|nr:hemolysin [candidate division SR1 bacterium RAAC1_SR1_1]HCY21807.1 GNAT family N-acetyltransferase [Candidatus Gracilibacteria bacterium]